MCGREPSAGIRRARTLRGSGIVYDTMVSDIMQDVREMARSYSDKSVIIFKKAMPRIGKKIGIESSSLNVL